MSTKITKKWLVKHEACEAAIMDFSKEYPDGLDLATLSEEELKTAVSKMKYWISWVYDKKLTDVIGLTLRDADLRGANLRRANLRDADLRDADLRDADLRRANLRGADLRRVDLRDADLRGANLRYANLRYANLRRANLRDAKYDNSTEFPDGFDIPDKMVLVD